MNLIPTRIHMLVDYISTSLKLFPRGNNITSLREICKHIKNYVTASSFFLTNALTGNFLVHLPVEGGTNHPVRPSPNGPRWNILLKIP